MTPGLKWHGLFRHECNNNRICSRAAAAAAAAAAVAITAAASAAEWRKRDGQRQRKTGYGQMDELNPKTQTFSCFQNRFHQFSGVERIVKYLSTHFRRLCKQIGLRNKLVGTKSKISLGLILWSTTNFGIRTNQDTLYIREKI